MDEIDVQLRQMVREWQQSDKSHDWLLEQVAQKFGWTIGQAYWATDGLVRPENFN